MRKKHPIYWAITGTVIGISIIGFDLVFIAYPCLLIGLGLLIYGVIRLGSGGFWAALPGLGTLPALILLGDIVASPPPCSSLSAHAATCGYIPSSYYLFAALFGAIALIGLAWGLFQRLRATR